ncbi:MAG TPA: hypothetical protein VLA76_00145 [Candidatus Angelobacter sp.]|nr:hypothetical protein [Candidatus Angelobacter sp.]
MADAATLADWFTTDAAPLRAEYEAGTLRLVEPRSVAADLVAELATRIEAAPETLSAVADEIDRLGFDLRDPATRDVARWVAGGLDPRRAAYAAVAEAHDLTLATDDAELRRAVGPRAGASTEA